MQKQSSAGSHFEQLSNKQRSLNRKVDTFTQEEIRELIAAGKRARGQEEQQEYQSAARGLADGGNLRSIEG